MAIFAAGRRQAQEKQALACPAPGTNVAVIFSADIKQGSILPVIQGAWRGLVIVVLTASSPRAFYSTKRAMSLSEHPDHYRAVITDKAADSKNSTPASPTVPEAQKAAEFDSGGGAHQISLASTSEYLPDISQGICLRSEVERFEKELIKHALKLAKGRQKIAARLLGLGPSTLHSKIRKHDLRAEEWKPIRK
jgi:hypothetical protein